MDFWDAVSRGMDRLANKLDEYSDRAAAHGYQQDTEFSVMNKDYCWEDLDYAGNDTLQRHVVTGECRIVDKYGQTVDRGTQAQLEEAMNRRHAQLAAAQSAGIPFISGSVPVNPVSYGNPVPVNPGMPMNYSMPGNPVPAAPVNPVNPYVGTDPTLQRIQPMPTQQVQARYGDIIGVVRKNGAYEHYGIYVSDTCVIHYAIPASMTIGHATVHATNLRNFLRDDSEYFVLDFPKPYQPPLVIGNNNSQRDPISDDLAKTLQRTYGYHLYTPEETVARARSRLGETHYNLLTNNCEHFVIWCKTGVSESLQISGMLQSLLNSQTWQFRKPVFR